MKKPQDRPGQLLVTSGTKSWERAGAETDHHLLADFLEEVAATETIQTAMSLAVARMKVANGSSALDLGCGTGSFFEVLAGAVGESGAFIGLDHSAGFLANARRRADAGGYGSRVTLIQGDAHDLPFPTDSFDAAHTERVLMHLDDPDVALRELMRVVRPGGWVVCVEPDLRGMRVDHPDAYRAGKILSGFCASIQHPAMGLELNRRMAEAGFVERSIDVLTEVSHEYDEDAVEFFTKAARLAVDNGWISSQESDTTLIELQRAADRGLYTSYASMFVVAGKVPSGNANPG
jgi:SAM-dependent methyltransferase